MGVLYCIIERAKIEKIQAAICILQKAITLTTYFVIDVAGKIKIIPAGIKNAPNITTTIDSFRSFIFSVNSPAVMLPINCNQSQCTFCKSVIFSIQL
ncbi:hypothetical protein D3Z38_17650 [Clostridiales bacterium]|nr:hypothetical protein [Clostridiales bacterium]